MSNDDRRELPAHGRLCNETPYFPQFASRSSHEIATNTSRAMGMAAEVDREFWLASQLSEEPTTQIPPIQQIHAD